MTTTLTELKILALDCQATGANPGKGRLLEIGWMPACANSPVKPETPLVRSYLIRLKPDTEISGAVKRITGISDTSMTNAVPSDTVWQHLINAARTVAAENQTAACPTVIHFAGFEEPFLRELHQESDPASPFPFQIICTHAIAIRLLPDLPRRGIRALAGYFGHSMHEYKRSAHHAVATVSIWQNIVSLLRTHCNVHTLQQLTGWLAATNPPKRSKRMFPMNSQIRLHLPLKPGIYRMQRANGDLLYIGKAKSLKQRVNSYFRHNASQPEHILEMLTQAWNLDFSLTKSALEAAILESDEIKLHSPPYNRALRRRQCNLVYCSKDLRQHSNLCDHQFSLGPLPGGKLIDAVAAFGTWLTNGMRLTGDDRHCIGYTVLALPLAYAPEIGCLREGFDLFRSNHRNRLENQSPLRAVTALGAQLWRQHREALALDEADAEREIENDDSDGQHAVAQKAVGQGNEASVNAHVWTPAAVAGVIESMLMRGAHLIRRARWFCLLSESALAWASADNPDTCNNLIVFEKGLIRDRHDLHVAKEIPVPPGFAKAFHARQKNFDLIAYDRLRVVTTELRRIIFEGRRIELRLSPTVSLKRNELKKALKWV